MTFDVFVEIPRGSRNKYEHDKEAGVIRLDRVLFSPMHYPTDYGYVVNTLADDGDPLDAMVLLWEPTFPGCVITCRALGVLNMSDEKGRDQKILCLPVSDPFWKDTQELEQAPQHLLKEISHFFEVYKTLEKKKVTVEGWEPRTVAESLIIKAQQAYK